MNDPAFEPKGLSVRSLSFGLGETELMRNLSFDLPPTGITAIMGPSGGGKSTLLRTFARRAELLPSFWHTGTVTFDGKDLLNDWDAEQARKHVAFFMQKARLYTASVIDNIMSSYSGPPMTYLQKQEYANSVLGRWGLWDDFKDQLGESAVNLHLHLQRCLSLARIVAESPHVILVDEPERDISDQGAEKLITMLGNVSKERAVILVTHNQMVSRKIADRVLLVVSGRKIADSDTQTFFENPPNEQAKTYVTMGTCSPFVDETPEQPEDEPVEINENIVALSAPLPQTPQPQSGPDIPSFRWVVPGKLGGMARPGLLTELPDDLLALSRLGISTIVCLEETQTVSDFGDYGFESVHIPVIDMEAPTFEQAYALAVATEGRIAQTRSTVYHCKAGLGRTGTMLACFLIYRGMGAVRALEEIRTVQRLYVQSEEQVSFLHAFEAYCRDQNTSGS